MRFGQRRFATPTCPDSDGLLFQYGTYSFTGPRLFHLDLTRQFAVVDDDGEHDYFVQVHCELRYEPVPVLAGLGNFTSWYFHGGVQGLDSWFSELASKDVWVVLRPEKPLAVEVYQEAL